MFRKSFQDIADSGNRLIGKGVCVDCHKFSGKYKRCFKCNKSNQNHFNEKKHRQEEYEKKSRILMITRGKECIKNGGKQCNIICPNCSPMEKWDENLQEMVKVNLDALFDKRTR